MPTLALPPAVLNRLTAADESRVLKALDALHSGSMSVSYKVTPCGRGQAGSTIWATVTSTHWARKQGKLTASDKQYAVQIHDRGVDCSCPGFGFSKTHEPCKHVLALIFAIEHEHDAQHAA